MRAKTDAGPSSPRPEAASPKPPAVAPRPEALAKAPAEPPATEVAEDVARDDGVEALADVPEVGREITQNVTFGDLLDVPADVLTREEPKDGPATAVFPLAIEPSSQPSTEDAPPSSGPPPLPLWVEPTAPPKVEAPLVPETKPTPVDLEPPPSPAPPCDALPRADEAPRAASAIGAKPSTTASGVKGALLFVAGVLIGAGGVLFLQHDAKQSVSDPRRSPDAPVAPSVSAATAAPSEAPSGGTVASPATTAAGHAIAPSGAAPAVAPTASAQADADAAALAPLASASTPTMAPAAGDVSSLSATEGFLVVQSSASLGVYVTGKFFGATNQSLRIPCGVRFVRLAALTDPPAPSPAAWLTGGTTVVVACKATTTAAIERGAAGSAAGNAPRPDDATYP